MGPSWCANAYRQILEIRCIPFDPIAASVNAFLEDIVHRSSGLILHLGEHVTVDPQRESNVVMPPHLGHHLDGYASVQQKGGCGVSEVVEARARGETRAARAASSSHGNEGC